MSEPEARPRSSSKVDGRSYYLPNDDRETDRLTQLHYFLRTGFEGLYKAPIKPILEKENAKMLDVGCGPGVWLLEMATDYPLNEFHGVDIFPSYPQCIRPQNVHFGFGNVLNKLPFKDGEFDYVRQSLLVTGIQETSWLRVVGELKRVTRKGGWIELVEMDLLPINMGPIQTEIIKKIHHVLLARENDIRVACRLGTLLEEAGLVKVETENIQFPYGWGESKMGGFMRENMEELLRSADPTLSEPLIQASMDEAKRYKSAISFYHAFGQVPE